jgi:SAM-dependent MidA family methyltransferase
MNPLQKQIAERIRSSGPLPFAAFMQIALYDSNHGYYSAGAQRTGWRGHFITSPELDPSFGTLWERAFRAVWVACGSPDAFEVVEIGPGEGSFAQAVLDAAGDDFRDVLTYRMVERTPAVRERQQERLGATANVVWTESVTELPDIPFGCVFANEILDNLPIHLVEMRDGEVVELCVGEDEGELGFVTRPPSNPELLAFLERTGMGLSEGERAEATLAAESLISRVAGRLGAGAAVFVDYGMDAADIVRRGGTVVAYSSSGADTEVLAHPGERDITAHANWTSAESAMRRSGMTTHGPLGQRAVLLSLGARVLDASFKDDYETAISEARGADAVACISRRQALGALLDPGGLGGLQVLAGFKGIDTPAFLA